jgi:hypothetical protein
MATTIASFLQQSDALEAARAREDLAAGMAAVAQGVLLALPLIAIALFFVTLARVALRITWRASGRSRTERFLGAGSIAAVALLVALVWSRPIASIGAGTVDALMTHARAIRDAAPIAATAPPTQVAQVVERLASFAPSIVTQRAAPVVSTRQNLAPSAAPTQSPTSTATATPTPTATPTSTPTPTPTPSPTTTGSTK